MILFSIRPAMTWKVLLRLILPAVLSGLATAQGTAIAPASATKVEWSKQVPIHSLADIDADLQADFAEEPVEAEKGDGDKVMIRTCADFLALVADGGDVRAGGSTYQIFHEDGLFCYTLQLLKDAHPAKTSFLKDFKFDRKAINVLSPMVGMIAGNQIEAQNAEGRQSLKQFEPSLKVTSAKDDKLQVETDGWEAEITYLARGDFDGKGVEEILIEVRGSFKEGEGPRGVGDHLYILTRSTNSGPMKVVRDIE